MVVLNLSAPEILQPRAPAGDPVFWRPTPLPTLLHYMLLGVAGGQPGPAHGWLQPSHAHLRRAAAGQPLPVLGGALWRWRVERALARVARARSYRSACSLFVSQGQIGIGVSHTATAATVNVQTQEAIEVLAFCLHHKENLILSWCLTTYFSSNV